MKYEQFEIGLLFGPPCVWKPAIEKYDGASFLGYSITWLFASLMVRLYYKDVRP